MKNFLRWLAVVPAAILACCLTYFIFVAFSYVALRFDIPFLYSDSIRELTSKINSFVSAALQIVGNGVASYMFVVAGTFVAPKGKRYVSICLATLIGLILLVTLVAPITGDNRSWIDYASYIFAFIGIIVGVIETLNTYKEDKAKPKV